MEIYVSTSALKNPFDISRVLEVYKKSGFAHVELGSSHRYDPNIKKYINVYSKDMNFVVHNYFPPHEEPFALNIASIDEDIRKKSVQHGKDAIDLCFEISSPIYSIHAGMLTNPRKIEFFEGFTFDDESPNESIYELAFLQLIKSCLELNEYAKSKNVKFAIENSGGHPKKFKNLLMTKAIEFENLLNHVNDPNFGILLDVGHYKLSETIYKEENINNFIGKFQNKIFQVHLHYNDGSNDQHLAPTTSELELIKKLQKDTIVVLESMKNEIEELILTLTNMRDYLSHTTN
jgi:sugar phosphate isomerase/epimerase